MDRDWDAEEAALRARVTTTLECLMGIMSVSQVQTRRGEVTTRYVAEEAHEAYQKARAVLDTFIYERWVNDASRQGG